MTQDRKPSQRIEGHRELARRDIASGMGRATGVGRQHPVHTNRTGARGDREARQTSFRSGSREEHGELSDERAGRPRVVVPAESGKVFKDRDAARWERDPATVRHSREASEHLSPEEQERKLVAELAAYAPVEPPRKSHRQKRRPRSSGAWRLGAPAAPQRDPAAAPLVHRSESINRAPRCCCSDSGTRKPPRRRQSATASTNGVAPSKSQSSKARSSRLSQSLTPSSSATGGRWPSWMPSSQRRSDKLGELPDRSRPTETTDDRLRSLELTR